MDEQLRAVARRFETGRRSRPVLSAQRIVFLVVAAAAPLAAMVGTLPIAIGRGNGAGIPAAFLLAAATLICFAVGYAAMARRVVNTGAFYTYAALGLGKVAGVATAFVALVAYPVFTVGSAVALGYFVNLALETLGLHSSWLIYSGTGIVIIGVLGYRSVDLSSRLLGALMLAEIAILGAFDISVVVGRGWGAFPLASFDPVIVSGQGFSIALMFAYTSFTGFESAALYGEEAKEPRRSIPVATFASVILIGGFYFLTAWITVGGIGAPQAQAVALRRGGDLMLDLVGHFAGGAMGKLTGLLVCTSILASYLAVHNACSRYIFALSREKLLPPVLGHFHPTRYAPSNASLALSLLTAVCVAGIGLTRIEPYRGAMPVLIGVATLGVIILQAIAAVAIIAYFRQRPRSNPWTTLVFPALGLVGLVAAAVLVAIHFKLLTARQERWINILPLAYVLAAVLGLGFALWLKKARPQVWAGLAQMDLRPDAERPAPRPISYDGRICIVGAGPGGLVAARALKLAGIPYDQFERHNQVGGIWDINNAGSSMYESAHFISSKYTSGFFGMPMPEAYPDYPDHRQILTYVQQFAESYGLTPAIALDTEVTRAEPLGEGARAGWRVSLNTGETRHYSGLICANGVTWHPNLPDYPGLANFSGDVRHSNSHRAAADFAGRRVLIVGAGNSGVDIACDAARTADAAFLSVRRGYRFVPKHIFGVPTDVFLLGQVRPPVGVVLPDDPSRMLDALSGDLTRYGLPAPDHKALESHPIMNTQVLHHLAHGDLIARRDIRTFTPTGAIFTDGVEENFDLVIFATGYDYKIPYLDEALFTWNRGHPDLYLNMFHRTLAGLSVMGFVELASAGYQRFDDQAQMIAMDAYIRQSGQNLTAWTAMKASGRPNLRGPMTYINSPRHTNYVDADTYRRTLYAIRERFGWPDPGADTYESLRRA